MAYYGQGTVERPRREGEEQNFTQPQVQGPPPAAQPAPAVSGVQFVNGQWNNGGGGGNQGVNQDVNRYRDMAASRLGRQGPQIDQGQANEARGLQTDGMDMLGARARGDATPAQYLMGRQTQGAVAGLQSNAASIRGGAMARAAASRGAQALGSRIQAQGNQDQAALRAREMADGAGQYFGAATDQRTTDIGVATDQAKLQVGQNALNAQAANAYESLGYDVKNAALGQQLGRSAADQAAANTGRQQGMAEAASTWNNLKDAGSGIVGGVSGGVSAYDKSQRRDAPYDPNKTTSAVEAKRNIKPLSDKQAKALKTEGEGMLETDRQRRRDAGGSTVDTPGNESAARGEREDPIIRENPYGMSVRDRVHAAANEMSVWPDENYDNTMFARNDGSNPSALHAGIESRLAEDTGEGIVRANPYGDGAPKPANFGTGNMLGAAPGYADSRKGQPGYMFGGAPEATHGFERRDVAVSDPSAKREAYMLGRAHEMEGHKTGKPVEWAYGGRPKAGEDIVDKDPSKEGSAPRDVVSFQRATQQEQDAEAFANAHAPGQAPPAENLDARRAANADAYRQLSKSFGVQVPVGGPGGPVPMMPAAPAPAPPATPLQRVGGPAGPVRKLIDAAAVRSDERTKNVSHDSPMAAANRSMEPSSYEYKPEFTPPEQKPGEVNVGPMANKMKADPIAKTAIVEDPSPPHLLAIDKTKGLKLVMGGLADLQRQVDQMRGRK